MGGIDHRRKLDDQIVDPALVTAGSEPNIDERLDGATHGVGIDLNGESSDHAAGLQLAKPLAGGGQAQPDSLGQIGDGDSPVELKNLDDFTV